VSTATRNIKGGGGGGELHGYKEFIKGELKKAPAKKGGTAWGRTKKTTQGDGGGGGRSSLRKRVFVILGGGRGGPGGRIEIPNKRNLEGRGRTTKREFWANMS